VCTFEIATYHRPTDTRFYRSQKELDLPLIDQQVSMSYFYEIYGEANNIFLFFTFIYFFIYLFIEQNILTEGVFVTQMSIKVGISVWWFVLVTKNCCFMSHAHTRARARARTHTHTHE
jgi:hypothetical protein